MWSRGGSFHSDVRLCWACSPSCLQRHSAQGSSGPVGSGYLRWCWSWEQLALLFLKRFYLFIFRERGREGEREEEKHQCVVASRAPSTGDLACNLGIVPTGVQTGNPLVQGPALNPLSHSSQGWPFLSESDVVGAFYNELASLPIPKCPCKPQSLLLTQLHPALDLTGLSSFTKGCRIFCFVYSLKMRAKLMHFILKTIS